jgi:hypothetical protein
MTKVTSELAWDLERKAVAYYKMGQRVITLRLKVPGTFWTAAMGECFLFLRSQLLSGRWEVMLDNLTRQTAKQIIYHLGSETSANDNDWLRAA